MDLYKTVADFPNQSWIMSLIYSVADGMPSFFPMALFLIWLLGGGAAYFAILRSTGKKRFFHVATAFSFGSFVLSLLFASLNGEVIVMSGYWVGFYALMTGLSYLGLAFYK